MLKSFKANGWWRKEGRGERERGEVGKAMMGESRGTFFRQATADHDLPPFFSLSPRPSLFSLLFRSPLSLCLSLSLSLISNGFPQRTRGRGPSL